MPKSAPVFMQRERKPWQFNSDSKRIYKGRNLQREREALFASEPLCRPCKAQGRVTIATIRDHIVNLAAGGTDTRGNTQPICKACHDLKSRAESNAGRGGGPISRAKGR